MQRHPIPPYKPPPEIQDIIDQKRSSQAGGGQRRRTAVLPKRNWMQRNPRLFQITFLSSALLVFFSKPLYDAFFAPQLPPKGEILPPHKR